MVARPPQVTIASVLMCILNCVSLTAYEPFEGMSPGASLALSVLALLVLALPWPPELLGKATTVGEAVLGVRGDLEMHFFRYPERSPTESHAQCYWRVQDVDGLHAEISRAGIEKWPGARVTPVEDKPWGMREFALSDPNGTLVRIGKTTRR